MAWRNCYQLIMTFRPACQKSLFVLSLAMLAGCARPPAPAPAPEPAPVAVVPSPQALKAEWLKGYNAGFYDGKRLQARWDQAMMVPTTLPPPPPPASNPDSTADAPPATVQSAVVPPAAPPPPGSVFVPAGPAQPVPAAQ
jgi:hypothetical protein